MEFRVLGPVEIHSDDVVTVVGGRQPRLILAVLILDANRPVPVERLIDLIWAQAPPPSARAALQAMVSRLRATLRRIGAPAHLVGERDAYRLQVEPMLTDVHRFSALVQQVSDSPDDDTVVGVLDQALALWRDEPLLDVVDDEVRHRLCATLLEARSTAVEDRAEALLRLGQTRRVVRDLAGEVARHPYRQRLTGQLMLALYREGRPDRALEVYRHHQTRLADELGLDPATDLTRLHQLILQGDPALRAERAPSPGPPTPSPPAELPPDVSGFTGRVVELTQLDRATSGSTAPTIWILRGIPGVGKTALAVHWAHRARHTFPDGQLFIDLRGFDIERSPVTPSAALGQLLGGLGVDLRNVPDDEDARATLFRSRMAGLRILLVLDNARDARQVLPLLPSGGTVLITSRHHLGELVVRTGARSLLLNTLDPTESAQLLAVMLGDDAVHAEAAAAARLAQLCGHLPLALRIAAANLQVSGESGIAGLTRELTDGDPLTGLTLNGADDVAVTRTFALSYLAMPTAARRLFRRLGLVPGVSFTDDVAAALDPAASGTAGRTLRALAAAHLVEQRASGRYRFHDLLRRYAVDRLLAEEDDRARHDARERLLSHYLSTADAAGRRVIPHFVRLPRPVPEDPFADVDAALGWLDAEATNLMAAIQHAAEQGQPRYAWQLADALRSWFHQRGRRTEWLAAATAGLTAAEAEHDVRAEAIMHLSIALAQVTSGHYEDAREHLLAGLRVSSADDWPEGRIGLLNNLSAVHQRLGDPRAAIDCARNSLTLNRQHGSEGGETMPLANLGFAHWQLGALAEADRNIRAALSRARQNKAHYNEAVLLVDLAGICRDRGDHEQAERLYDRALSANRDLNYRYGEATALSGRALLWSTTGRAAAAGADAEHAVTLTREIGDLGTEAWAREALGRVLLAAGLLAESAQEFDQALHLARRTRFVWCEANALVGLAAACLAAGDPDAARTDAEAALRIAVEAGYRVIETHAVRLLARLRESADDRVGARELHRRADRLAGEMDLREGHPYLAR
ncbi:AfsR/SARP family transcriptional regulator [Micromonospora robiginosa]|uniref:BTAD domain-containing putative transcriptional regulator n=1 Tax=Micromonospora robiginosa TaxID=2749844 RepID=A0A7L6B3Z6_9ACTN|nr:BTAD domain-containing putative transcriptional regulator [Micromonospora ferruginea]QLQ36659.1 BTAD domain-containing putative transcriptional regulator [Micromonospora ferruginea]